MMDRMYSDSRNMLILLTLLLFARGFANYQAYQSPDNVNCLPCPPGNMVNQHCSEDVTNSTCSPCPANHYSNSSNDKTFCQRCQPGSCPARAYLFQPCTQMTNIECRCEDGYHQQSIDPIDNFFECRKHSSCPIGQGVIALGTYKSDTLCEPCQADEYVDEVIHGYPTCQNCSVCYEGEVEIQPCKPNVDTQCEQMGPAPTQPSASPTGTIATSAPPEIKAIAGLSVGRIIGIGVGIIALLVIIGIAMFKYARRKKKLEHAHKNYDYEEIHL